MRDLVDLWVRVRGRCKGGGVLLEYGVLFDVFIAG